MSQTVQKNGDHENKEDEKEVQVERVLVVGDELKLHLYGTELIFEAGLMLQIPQITIAIGQQIYVEYCTIYSYSASVYAYI